MPGAHNHDPDRYAPYILHSHSHSPFPFLPRSVGNPRRHGNSSLSAASHRLRPVLFKYTPKCPEVQVVDGTVACERCSEKWDKLQEVGPLVIGSRRSAVCEYKRCTTQIRLFWYEAKGPV